MFKFWFYFLFLLLILKFVFLSLPPSPHFSWDTSPAPVLCLFRHNEPIFWLLHSLRWGNSTWKYVQCMFCLQPFSWSILHSVFTFLQCLYQAATCAWFLHSSLQYVGHVLHLFGMFKYGLIFLKTITVLNLCTQAIFKYTWFILWCINRTVISFHSSKIM